MPDLDILIEISDYYEVDLFRLLMKIVSKMPEKEHDTKRELIFSVAAAAAGQQDHSCQTDRRHSCPILFLPHNFFSHKFSSSEKSRYSNKVIVLICNKATDAPDDSGSTGEAAGESGNPDVAGEDAAKYEAGQEDDGAGGGLAGSPPEKPRRILSRLPLI